MAIDPEELKRRREQRKQQRKKQQRSMKIKLIIAGVCLLLCTVLVLTITGKRSQPNHAGNQATEQIQPDQTVIHLGAVGDLNVNEAVVGSGGMHYVY